MEGKGSRRSTPWPRRGVPPAVFARDESRRNAWTIRDDEWEHLCTLRPHHLSEQDWGVVVMPPGIHGSKVRSAAPSHGARPRCDAGGDQGSPPDVWASIFGPAVRSSDVGATKSVPSSQHQRPARHETQEKLTSSALYEDEKLTPIIRLPAMRDDEWNARGGAPIQASSSAWTVRGPSAVQSGAAAKTASSAWTVRAPPAVQSGAATKTAKTAVLCPLPTNLQRTRTAKNVQTWKPKEADMTPVTKPFPSEIMLPSLVDETEDEDTTGPGDGEGGHVNAIDDEDDDDNFILARLLCKPTPAINNGDILRVVSFDDEFSETESPQVRHTKALADGGDDELTEIAASSEPEEEDLVGRTAASPRRLDFKEAAGPPEDLTIFDVVPSADALPKTGREYATLMGRVLAESDPDLASRKAECVLHFMLKEYKCGRSKIRPDGGMYNKVMHAYAMQGMPERVEDLLQLMCDEYDGGDELATPNVRHYTTLLLAWQTANVSEAPVRSEAIVAKMHKMYESGTLPTCKPDVITYTSVLHSWSISHRQDAAVRAETLFREMKRRYEAGDNDLRPDVLAYSNLMNAITNSGGFAHAEDILWEMVDEYIKGNESCKPQIRNVNSILAGWAKATAPYAPERAEEIVRRWLRLNESNDISALPDSYTYCLVLKCWAISTRKDAADRTKKFMIWLQSLAEKGDDGARLEPVKIASCMTAWMNSRSYRHAADFLENTCRDALNGKHKTIPDYQHFKKTIHGLCNVNNVARADAMIRLAWKVKAANLPLLNDTLSLVKFVSHQWLILEHPDRAESLVLAMASHYRQGNIPEYPGWVYFEVVVQAWKKSKFHDKHTRVKLLQEKQSDFMAFIATKHPNKLTSSLHRLHQV